MRKDNIVYLEEWKPMAAIQKHLGVSRETVPQYVNKRGMTAHKLGRQCQFKISEVEEWLRSESAAGTDEADANELNGGLQNGD